MVSGLLMAVLFPPPKLPTGTAVQERNPELHRRRLNFFEIRKSAAGLSRKFAAGLSRKSAAGLSRKSAVFFFAFEEFFSTTTTGEGKRAYTQKSSKHSASLKREWERYRVTICELRGSFLPRAGLAVVYLHCWRTLYFMTRSAFTTHSAHCIYSMMHAYTMMMLDAHETKSTYLYFYCI